jgi:branched-chain amino acid transport system permease protein
MVVIGGLGSLPGAALGAAIVVLLPEFLRASGEYRLIIFGVLVVLLMGITRGGLMGLLVTFGERIARLWRGTGAAAVPVARPSEP